MPTAAEKLVWASGSPDDVKVVPATLLSRGDYATVSTTLSAAICWENYMPLFRYRLYELGTEIYCAPTVDGRESWANTMKHVAFEGRCFVLSANQFSRQKVVDDVIAWRHRTVAEYPRSQNHPSDVAFGTSQQAGEDIVIAGGSMIIDPHGKVLAGPLRGQEG